MVQESCLGFVHGGNISTYEATRHAGTMRVIVIRRQFRSNLVFCALSPNSGLQPRLASGLFLRHRRTFVTLPQKSFCRSSATQISSLQVQLMCGRVYADISLCILPVVLVLSLLKLAISSEIRWPIFNRSTYIVTGYRHRSIMELRISEALNFVFIYCACLSVGVS